MSKKAEKEVNRLKGASLKNRHFKYAMVEIVGGI